MGLHESPLRRCDVLQGIRDRGQMSSDIDQPAVCNLGIKVVRDPGELELDSMDMLPQDSFCFC